MKKAFDHIGIPTTEPQAGEFWVPFSKVWVTNPRAHPLRLEYLRAKERPFLPPEQVGLWKLWNWPHVAYRVEDLKAALAGEEVVFGPFIPDSSNFVEVGFVHKDGIIIEYMQYANLDHWFGQPNPPSFVHVPYSE